MRSPRCASNTMGHRPPQHCAEGAHEDGATDQHDAEHRRYTAIAMSSSTNRQHRGCLAVTEAVEVAEHWRRSPTTTLQVTPARARHAGQSSPISQPKMNPGWR